MPLKKTQMMCSVTLFQKEGSNIWFDGWIMPKGANRVVAQRFVNFVSSRKWQSLICITLVTLVLLRG